MTSEEKLKQSRDNLRKIFAENPDLKKIFKETLDEMSKPENVEKMASDICAGIKILSSLKNGVRP